MTDHVPDTHQSVATTGPLALKSNLVLGPNAQAVDRWYCVSRDGRATLCVDEEDARANAAHCDQAWRAGSPHRAVRLVDAPRWVPVAERLPLAGQTVLACYVNRANKLRRIRAHWIAAKTEESSGDNDFGEYDEEADTYWTPEGWYEQIDNWGEYSAVAVCEGTVTHWMPLPAPPKEPA